MGGDSMHRPDMSEEAIARIRPPISDERLDRGVNKNINSMSGSGFGFLSG
jgi:hypothetical protein